MLTFSAQYTIDGTSPDDRAKAHAFVDAIFGMGGTVAIADTAQAEEEGASLKELDPEELRTFLQQLEDGVIGKPFNDDERRMFLAIAECSPEPYGYGENRELLGTGRKFGNVSSGLARRFWRRGYDRPFQEGDGGYVMDRAAADVVQAVLAPEEA